MLCTKYFQNLAGPRNVCKRWNPHDMPSGPAELSETLDRETGGGGMSLKHVEEGQLKALVVEGDRQRDD